MFELVIYNIQLVLIVFNLVRDHHLISNRCDQILTRYSSSLKHFICVFFQQ